MADDPQPLRPASIHAPAIGQTLHHPRVVPVSFSAVRRVPFGEHFGFHGLKVEKLAELNGALRKALAATKEGNTSILNVVLTD